MLACKKCVINMRTVWYKVNDKIEKKETNKMHFVDIQLDLVQHTPEKSTWSQPILKMDKSALKKKFILDNAADNSLFFR